MNDSSHFYDKTGGKQWSVPNKSKPGEYRPATLADAKKNNWYISPTTAFKVLAKPELEKWKFAQIIHAALTLPLKPNESDEDYCARIIRDAFEQVQDAADIGGEIHRALELHFQGYPYDPKYDPYINPVKKWVADKKITFVRHEARVMDHSLGVAGTTDAVVRMEGYDGLVILDWKTRKTKPGMPSKPYSTEPIQASAYASPLGATGAFNVYISTTEIGRTQDAFYDHSRIKKEYEAFKHIVSLYRHINNFPLNVDSAI